jgi:uroporphyrinogen decarboxylase
LQTHPDLKIILYISGSGGLLERMTACDPDIMSIDQHVDMRDAIQRIGPKFAVQVRPASASMCALSLGVPGIILL